MKNSFNYIIVGLIILLTVSSCSRKKDRFINRSWHAVNTKYNVLFNGNIALESGKNDVITAYKDNYWEILPVERLQISDAIVLDDKAKNFIADKGYDSQFGARPLKSAIQKYLEDILAEEIVNSNLSEGDTISITLNDSESALEVAIKKAVKKKKPKSEE